MFNLGLYKEGLRKTTYLSALFIAVMLLGAVFTPISTIISQIQAIEAGLFYERIIISGIEANSFLLIVTMLFVPTLTLYMFSFLNKRNSSDFYHSIPHKRETIFVSFIAAILTWILGGIWLCTAITLAIYWFSPAYVIINTSSILLATLGLSIGCTLVIGVLLIAMSVSGSTSSSIITALLILFLPRIILASFISMLVTITPVVSAENFGIIGNSSYNIPVGIIVSSMWHPSPHIDQVLTQGILYTAILGLIYLGIGMVLFKRRKSEIAQAQTLNQAVQTVFTISIAFALCLPALNILTYGIAGSDISSVFTVILTWYAIALIIYFVLELIKTKKLPSMTKSLPGLGTIVLLNLVFIIGITFAHNAILDREFKADEIQSVRIASLDERRFGGYNLLPYETLRAREIDIRNEQLTGILLEELTETIEWIRNERNFNIRRGRGFLGLGISTGGPGMEFTVLFETTSGQAVRRNIISVGGDFYYELMQILNNHEDYAATFLTLPENPAKLCSGLAGNLQEDILWDIYEILREEVRELDLHTWRSITRNHSSLILDYETSYPIHRYGMVNARGFLGRHSYLSQYPITNFTPRAADKFIQHINIQNFEGVEHALENILATENALILGTSALQWLSISGYNTPIFTGSFAAGQNVTGRNDDVQIIGNLVIWDQFGFDKQKDYLDLDIIRVLLDTIRKQRDTYVDRECIHYSIQISAVLDSGEHFQGAFFFNSDNEELEELLEALQASLYRFRLS